MGETGLDFNRNFSTKANQLTAFQAQLDLAIEMDKPLFLHERDAADELSDMVSERQNKLPPAVVHCFTGNKKTLEHYLDMGLFIGVTGWVCDKQRGADLRAAVKYIPSDRLMIETDAPYLTPKINGIKEQLANRQRNEPWTLRYVAETISVECNKDINQVIEETIKTTKTFFRLPA